MSTFETSLLYGFVTVLLGVLVALLYVFIKRLLAFVSPDRVVHPPTLIATDINKPCVFVKLLDPKCELYHAHDTDSGFDVRARIDKDVVLAPNECVTIPTGVMLELPPGYEAQIRPRSGWSKKGVLAAYGTVDNGYRGEIAVTLCNVSQMPQVIRPYDRIAQLVVAPLTVPKVKYVDVLSKTERGERGFGSTGVN